MSGFSSIFDLLQRATDAGDVPGVAVSVATPDGVAFEGAAGKRDLANGAAMTPDTVVRIASMTKAITGACAMQLVEQGKLDLDAPIGALLPELGSAMVLEGYEADGKPRMRTPKRPITLRHLLTHTSGHTYDFWNATIGEYRTRSRTPPLGSGLLSSLSIPLLFDPGERWEYSISIDWVGRAVEEATGVRLADYMQSNLFGPLGMVDTGFRINDSQRARLAMLYARTSEGLTPATREPPANPEFDGGGGGLFSTVQDYTKFTQMILYKGRFNGAQILKPETVALMSQNAMGDIDVQRLPPVVPTLTNAVDFIDGMKWGLTFLINPTPTATGRSAGSLAWAGLMNSYYWIDPVKQVTGVYATQILPFCDVKSLKLFEDFERAVYEAM
ncbi:serine hydrolase domain-containing protein [Bradyrhizobium sp. LHD-71]|uniref:serine hydrolase domain-containing protein n=1 Tax=Bradyrhizobium sp. LHD-71 TaxID=3072141 RepID=UPI00280F1B0C|nr:serine hydrolase domain-containing protein [Bradyrhizobium sp. LHD-71]MDQ8730327.1 serine hydrolase domain-containing protein [Bradyrhizobium sp. LHD-71]